MGSSVSQATKKRLVVRVGQQEVLDFLMARPGVRFSVKRISELLGLSRGSVTNSVRRLSDSGFVMRVPITNLPCLGVGRGFCYYYEEEGDGE